MIPLSSCCNHPYNYKHLGNKEAEDHSNRGEEEEKMEEGPIRRSEGGAAGADVVLNVDSQSEDFNQERAMGGGSREGGGIWRGSSYDFLGESEKLGLPTAQGASDDKSQSFDFREGRDPPSKLIGDFLQRERISGQKSLDMDFDLEELHFAQEGDNSVSGKKRDYLSSVPETHTLQSGANSPGKGVVRSHLHGGSSPTPNSSMHARSPSASPKVQFESAVQIGSPVYEGGPRYSPKEDFKERSNRESGRKKSGIDDEVLRCSGRASPNLNRLRTKTKSRLIDPPQAQFQYGGEAASEMAYVSRRRSGQLKSGQLKSGIIGKNPGMLEKLNEDEEDDPFKDCDLPDEYKRAKWGFLGLFQWLSFFVIVGAFVCSLTVEYLKRKTVWDLHLWKWCLLVLVLFCGRLVSGWAIRLVVFFVERNFLLRKRVLYFVYGLRKAVQNCLWLGLVLLAWHYLFDKKVERETKSKSLRYVNKILVCLLVGTFIWLIKTLLVKVLASSFHVSTFFDRIQESLFNQYVLETLSGPPLIEIEQYNKEEEKLMAEIAQMKEAGAKIAIDLKSTSKSGLLKSGATTPRSGMIGKSGRSMGLRDNKQQDEGISIDHLHKLNQKNISAWNMKRLMNIVRHGVLSTLDESFQNAATEDESVTQIRSEWEAKAAAKKIFRNVAQPRAKHITIEDLMRFLREEEALKAMALFEGAQDTNQVNKAALKNWVVNVFRERRALALTLNDTKTAVNKLHRMVNVAVSLVIGVIWLLILGIATTHILVLISSQLLLVVFVFGNTCKTIFESIIFLFVMHPFDVGDRCSVEGVQMVVEEMNILTTVFLRYDNEKIWYPNSVLATKPISNFYRSPDMGDAVEFAIHIATPKEKVDIMKERIKRYVDNKVEHWYPNPMIVVKDIEDMNRMKMAVWLQHKMNHQDMGEKWLRRSHLVEEMITIFRDLDIEYRLLPMDVNIRKLPPPALVSNRLPSTWMT
ncbi:mechanosensitive ion channel protein 5 [Cryptomeria japonica]|uniref:mechanosensitive ion channel protein 5 n=1 Tax=Cryptomeria japonica TaxID=3369 RepID=UPI0025AC681F|nr:mechanosensitive ion channel protein 5 [Cryptomeria japonica]